MWCTSSGCIAHTTVSPFLNGMLMEMVRSERSIVEVEGRNSIKTRNRRTDGRPIDILISIIKVSYHHIITT